MQQLGDLLYWLPGSTIRFLVFSLLALTVTLFLSSRFPGKRFHYTGLFVAISLAGFGFALIDPFLHPWDEQFHALVAKNLGENPFHPRLLKDIPGGSNPATWAGNDTWLHKQPLFLWQIALSLKLFGNNLIALRLPSILMHALTACLVLAMAKRYLKPFFALLAAVLYGYCGFLLDLISGAQGMDHNDVAFIFYVTASCWSWMKYHETNSLKWAVLTGLFSGGAILCKWLTGLVVFAGWGLVILIWERTNKLAWKHLLTALFTTLVVAAPWQLYCSIQFPTEFAHEMAYNSLHFFKVVENHGGGYDFYFEGMKKIYGAGDIMRLFVLLGIVLTVIRALRKQQPVLLFGAIIFIVTYTFFSLAATKLEGYVLITAPFGFLFLVTPFDRLFEWIASKTQRRIPPAVHPFLVLIVLLLFFHSKGVIDRHNFRSPDTVDAWKKALLKAKHAIANAPAQTGCFLVKYNEGIIVPAIAFSTEKKVYEWRKELEKPGTIVIDLE